MKRCMGRNDFLRTMGLGAASLAMPRWSSASEAPSRKPNVLIILTDDQGYGDLGCHGNQQIQTPNLDRLYAQSMRLTQFYAMPVCAPSRACLMTGRYNYRTRAIDTWVGRAMMDPEEVTLAEVFAAAGYRTGIFGKWHLGDNYPMRAIDQGFGETLVHRGGGIGQPADPPGNGYFDPILQHNGKAEKLKGYCTDIFADATIRFIEDNRDRPFLAYLAPNVPHDPLQVSDEYVEPFLKAGLSERTSRIYGMIKNLDENVGRVLDKIAALNLASQTIVIFMTDNGSAMSVGPETEAIERYNAGMRGQKTTAYEGGIRVPCFIRWPGKFEAGRDVDRIAHMIDIMPTLLDSCGVAKPSGLALDGMSLMPLLREDKVEWPDRALHVQWHRGDAPQLYRNCAARSQRYKLVNGKELYDMQTDPGEKNDIADQHPEVVADLRKRYEAWFADVSSTRGYDPPRIHLGTEHENPTTLTPQDWRGAETYSPGDLGYYEVLVTRSGKYSITLRLQTNHQPPAEVHFRIGELHLTKALEQGVFQYTFEPVDLKPGPARLEAWVTETGKKDVGARYVDVERRG